MRSLLPLKVSFPVVRLPRGDAAEQGFVAMLLGSEPGLREVRGPIVLPVFGRGRLLCALHGKDLTGEQFGHVARFLCGACSCRVKELNPGVDLLLAADWEKMLDHPEVAEVMPPAPPPDRRPETQVQTSTPVPPPVDAWAVQPEPAVTHPAPPPPAASTGQQRWVWLAVGGAAVLVVITGAWALLSLTRPRADKQTLS